MTRLFIIPLISTMVLLGCGESKPVSNPVTKYAENLRDSREKAEIAAEKANKAIDALKKEVDSVRDSME